MEVNLRFKATVVLCPCSRRDLRRLLWESQVCFLAPWSVARGGSVSCESQHRLKSQRRLKSCMRI